MIDIPSVNVESCFITSFVNNLEKELYGLYISQIDIKQNKEFPINAQMSRNPDLDINQVLNTSIDTHKSIMVNRDTPESAHSYTNNE